MLKNTAYFILISLFLISCKSKSLIVTSVDEAKKKNIYQSPIQSTTSLNKKNIKVNKIEISEQERKDLNIAVLDDVTYDYAENPAYDKYFADGLIQVASENIGSRYQTGGMTKSGFDCSGLIYVAFKNFDITLPRTSIAMSRTGLRIKPIDAKKGDLIFFRTKGRGVINHVGMITEILDNEIKFIHASSSNGVMISSTKESYFKKTFAQVNRIVK